MKLIYSLMLTLGLSFAVSAQTLFDLQIDPNFSDTEVVVPASPLKYQILFIGGVDMVQTTATYGNPATEVPAKEWNDFIGFTPDFTNESLGWISINHERVEANDNIGDGGGMTTFRVMRDADTDTLIVVEQTLEDGRTGKFFNVDFANTTGETGMNCGGISSIVDGRIWTAEEWWRGDNTAIADRDTSDFIIGEGTVDGYIAPNGFPGFNGQQIKKYQNYNYMTEIDPRQARAVRKQYNWGRQAFEGGTVLPDNRTVILGVDATPGFLTKFVADVPGDFTNGKTYVYKHDGVEKWIELDNSDIDVVLNFKDYAVASEATMYNRLEWVTVDPQTGKVYMTETGRDNPGSRWADEHAAGAVHAPHHLARAEEQGAMHPDSAAYWDYYGRVLEFDPATDEVSVYLEAGPYFTESPEEADYPMTHLSNPDGLHVMVVKNKSYMVIQEDLNGTSHGRMPANYDNRQCELYFLDMSIEEPTLDDLVRIAVSPLGSEITGAIGTTDGKTLLVNAQHPSTDNPYPYNHSLTFALTGWDEALSTTTSTKPVFTEGEELQVYPNPVAQTLYLNKTTDVAIYNAEGKRIRVERNVKQLDIFSLAPGIYFLQTAEGEMRKIVKQ